MSTSSKWWWLSFADASRPKGQTNLGVCIVQGRDLADALANAWDQGCNPGGEVAGLGPLTLKELSVTEDQTGRMLTPEEVALLGVKRSQPSVG